MLFWVMIFQVSLKDGARVRLIAIKNVLFAVSNYRA
jgi:hypothetical protein